MMLTVFTPTFNRAKYLQRLYESLCRQKETDFEWLIVDDGSTDDTAAVVQKFQGLNIRYISKENGGKHTAYNEALKYACGKWFLCVDADDYLSDDALEVLTQMLRTMPEGRGLAAYKADQNGNRLSEDFPVGIAECRISDLALRLNCRGEFAFIFPTEIAKRYPFPVFSGEKFVGENVIYDRIEKECPVVLLPQTVMICEYLAEGYSQNFGGLMGKNPAGFCVYFLQRIDLMIGFKNRLVCTGKYWCFRWISGNKSLRYSGKHRFALLAGWFAGVAFRLYYKLVRGF